MRLDNKHRITRAVWEWLSAKAPKGSQPPNRWPVDMFGWFQASKISQTEATQLIIKHGKDEAQKIFERLVADRKATALCRGIVRTHSREAIEVYEKGEDIYKLYAKESDLGEICELSSLSGSVVLWILPNENGGVTVMFPEDY